MIPLETWRDWPAGRKINPALAWIWDRYPDMVETASAHTSKPETRQAALRMLCTALDQLLEGNAAPGWPIYVCDQWAARPLPSLFPTILMLRFLAYGKPRRQEIANQVRPVIHKHFPHTARQLDSLAEKFGVTAHAAG